MTSDSFFRVRPQTTTGPETPQAAIARQGWQLYQKLEKSQWLPAADLKQLQLLQLRRLLEHCVQQVPYYRRVLADAPAVATIDDLGRLPILPRKVLQENEADIQAATLPGGIVATGNLKTSGSSGIPIKVRQSSLTDIWWMALSLRDLEWNRIDPQGTLASIRAFGAPSIGASAELMKLLTHGVETPHWEAKLATLMKTGPSFCMDINQPAQRQLEWLLKINPHYILCYPTTLAHLAHLVKERRSPFPNLRAILSIAEPLTEDARAHIEAAFAVPVKNTYSCCEAGYLAAPCPEGHGLHVHGENIILEVVDAAGKPVAPGETGSVLLTVLHNYLTPLIRYQIGDEATLAPASCPCGRGLPLLLRVDGKTRPYFLLPNGTRKSPISIVDALYKIEGFRQYQIIQKTRDLTIVNIVPSDDWDESKVDRIKGLLHDFFAAPITVEVQVLPRMPLPESGKLRNIICDV